MPEVAKTLEGDFHKAMLGVYHSALSECNYRATRYLQMVTERGGLQAAKDLLRSDRYTEGLTELWKHGRLDLSVEALVLKEPWSSLFTEEELARARRRHKDLGWPPRA